MFDCLYLWFGGGLIDVTNAKIFCLLVVRYFRLLGFKIENNPWIRIHKVNRLTNHPFLYYKYDHRCNNETLRKLFGVICNLPFLQTKPREKVDRKIIKA